MIKFDLERALAGDKVITRDGREVTQLVKFDCDNEYQVRGVVLRDLCAWTVDGCYYATKNPGCDEDLFMAPKKLSGFANIYSNGVQIHENKDSADKLCSDDRLACIDLSQFKEGHGLCEQL